MRTIDEIRRDNLRHVIDNEFPSARQLALKMGTNPNNLSRIFSDKEAHRRNVGDDMARSVERAASKPRGWMDIDHSHASGEVQDVGAGYGPGAALGELDADSLTAWILETINDLPPHLRIEIAQAALADLPTSEKPAR